MKNKGVKNNYIDFASLELVWYTMGLLDFLMLQEHRKMVFNNMGAPSTLNLAHYEILHGCISTQSTPASHTYDPELASSPIKWNLIVKLILVLCMEDLSSLWNKFWGQCDTPCANVCSVNLLWPVSITMMVVKFADIEPSTSTQCTLVPFKL